MASRLSVKGGSSPRVWGTLHIDLEHVHSLRFIPTRVGNTAGFPLFCSTGAVHPHACGEHFLRVHIQEGERGSSPRVWGTPDNADLTALTNRFIPTRVGNTILIACAYEVNPVHPHACGEHALGNGLVWPPLGSSPRVWGTRMPLAFDTKCPRFIPTRVGNTGAAVPTALLSAVHPHACGEHLFGTRSRLIDSGSSPRVWGTQ